VPASALVLAALVAAAPGPRLEPPVPGAAVRAFAYAGDPFARGHHRGVDLAVAPGEAVRAACSGRVSFAGRAGAVGRAVAVRCGAWSVTHLPLREVAVRAGEHVVAGAPLGTAAGPGRHAGLHLGVRRASDPLGYVDPAPLLASRRRTPPPAGPPPGSAVRRETRSPAHPEPVPSAPQAARAPLASAPQPATPASHPGSSPAREHGARPVAPWPVWAGLALLLSGAIGAGTVRVARRRRVSLPRAVAREVP